VTHHSEEDQYRHHGAKQHTGQKQEPGDHVGSKYLKNGEIDDRKERCKPAHTQD